MPSPRLPATVACLLAALLATACGALRAPSAGAPPGAPAPSAAAPAAPAAPPTIDGTPWALVTLAGRPPARAAAATLRFDGDRVSGSDGCNRFAGPGARDGARLRIGPNLASTQRACPEPQRGLASAYLRALEGTTGWRLDGRALVLLGEAGAPLASFEPQAAGLAGTAWRVVAYNTGRRSVTGVGTGRAPTIEFGTAGGVRGFAGCNTFGGAWSEDAGRIAIGPLRATKTACADPPDAMEREAALLQALESAASVRRDGDRLELRTATGAIAVTAVAPTR